MNITPKKITHWTEHSKAMEVLGLEYAIVQGFVENTKDNWKPVDDLRDEIDFDINNNNI